MHISDYNGIGTLRSLLDFGVTAGRDREIVTHGGMRFPYPHLAERIRRLGALLTAMGTCEAMRVGILDRNTHRSLEACFAVPMIGATLVTIDPRVTPDQLRKIQRRSGLHLLLASSEFVPMVCEALARVPVVPRLVTMGKAGDYEAMIAASDAFFEFPAVTQDADALHFYRASVAGCAERHAYTHRQLVNSAQSLCELLTPDESATNAPGSDVYLHILPMSDLLATSMPYAATFLGLKQVYPGQWDTFLLPALIAAEKVTLAYPQQLISRTSRRRTMPTRHYAFR